MSTKREKLTYQFAYDESMTEVAVIFKCKTFITPETYIAGLEAWLEFCRYNLHSMYKGRPSLENDPNLT